MNAAARAAGLFKAGPKAHRSGPEAIDEPAKERQHSELWKTLAGDSGLRFRPVPPAPRELTVILGQHKAALLTQLDYWLHRSEYQDATGRRWIYNTFEEWRVCVPDLSLGHIKRLWRELRNDDKLVFVKQFDVSRLRRENWYSLDYEALQRLRPRIAEIAKWMDETSATVKQRRRFSSDAQPLLNRRFEGEGWEQNNSVSRTK